MGSKTSVKHYKYKNIAAAMAILLIGILALSPSCGSGSADNSKNKPAASVSSVVKNDASSSNEESSEVFKAPKLTKNYKYVSVKNSESLGSGNLILLNSTYKYEGGVPTDLDGVYGYLFDESGAQIGSTSSTQVMGRKEMLRAFNSLLCGFYDETGLKTLMVNDMYVGSVSGEENDSEDSASVQTEKPCYEHDSGLAVDLQLYLAEEGTYPAFDGTGRYSWIIENCWKYGFVQRYTQDKVSLTRVEQMANHFRYVGVPHAEIMHLNGLCLEEYLDFVKQYTFEKPYSFESSDGNCYAIYYTEMSSEKNTNCPIPLNDSDEEYEYEISGDNMSGYIICVKLISAEESSEQNTDDASSVSDIDSSDSQTE